MEWYKGKAKTSPHIRWQISGEICHPSGLRWARSASQARRGQGYTKKSYSSSAYSIQEAQTRLLR